MQRRRLYVCGPCTCVSFRLLSHLSLMFAQSREFLTSIIRRLSFSPDTLVGPILPFFRRPFAAIPSLLTSRGPVRRRTSLARELPVGIMLFYFWLIATRGRRHYSRMNIQRRSRGRKSSAPRKLPSRFRDYVRCPSSTSSRFSAQTTHISS